MDAITDIRNNVTGEIVTIRPASETEIPEWVYEQTQADSFSGLQHMLDQMSVEDFRAAGWQRDDSGILIRDAQP